MTAHAMKRKKDRPARRGLTLLLAMILCLACTGTAQGEGEALTIFSQVADTEISQHGDVPSMQELSRVTGVDVEWVHPPRGQEKEQFNLMVVSQDLTDIIYYNWADYSGGPEKAILDEVILPLNDYIDAYAPNLKAFFEANPEAKRQATTDDGTIYMFPFVRDVCLSEETMGLNFTQGPIYRLDWAEQLGIDPPQTIEDWYEMLCAFRDNDMNGNGDPNDEIPMDFIWNDNTNNQYGPANMLGGTGMPLSNGYIQGFFAEDGEVKCWYTDERFQSLLIYLQGLWNQGLINEAAFTNDYSQYQALARGEGTTAKVGFTFGWNLTDRFGNELADQYVVLPPLKADDSLPDDQLYYVSEDTFWGKGVVSMSASCENKEAAMRFINQFYDYDVSLEVMYGGMNDVDNCIVKNDDGTYEVLPPKDSSMDPSSWQWTNTFVNNGGMWVRNDVQVKTPVPDLTLGEKETYLPYQESIPTNSLFKNDLMKYSQEDQNTLAMVETNLGNIWDPQVANWITGTNDIATEWEAYVDSLKNAGLDQALEIKQAAFDTYLEATGN